MLHPNSILYISVIEGDYAQSQYELFSTRTFKIFIHYYDEAFIRQQLEENNFKTIAFSRKKVLKSNGENSNQIIFIARKM